VQNHMTVWPTLSRTAIRNRTDRMQSMKAALLLPMFCGLSVTTVSPAKADELIEMLFGVNGLKPAKHRAYILHCLFSQWILILAPPVEHD